MSTNTSAGKTSMMVKISLLSVIAFCLMLIESIIPFFPPFLKLDISDLPALLAGFSMGPVAGVLVEAVKNILHLLKTETGGVGELANFLVGSALVVPAAAIYLLKKDKKHAFLGLMAGIVSMAAAGALVNYFIILPFYSTMFPIDAVIEMSAKANAGITDLKTLILYGIVPFNLFKGTVVALLTLAVYKRISPVLHR